MLGVSGERQMELSEALALVDRLHHRGFMRTGSAGEMDEATFFGQTQRAPSLTVRLAGVSFAVRDLAGMKRFYHDVLGLPILLEYSDRVAFRLGLGVLYLETARPDGTNETAIDNATTDVLPIWQTDDLRTEVVRLRGRGVACFPPVGDFPSVSAEISDTTWGLASCFADPEGHWWRLVQPSAG